MKSRRQKERKREEMRLQREKEREGRARSKKGEEDSGDAPQVPEWAEDVDPAHVVSVSYTHLTLPTILLV